MKLYRILILFFACIISNAVFAQKENKNISKVAIADTSKKNVPKKDTVTVAKPKLKHDPRIATRRSLIFPGLGQIYNKEYWKLPIVYGVIAIPTITFFYNNTWYKRTKFAYETKFAFNSIFDTSRVAPTFTDSAGLREIYPQLKNLSAGSLQGYRNQFRRDRDYSVLWFVIAWGLNVADATVFGHLKEFDVSDNLSMQVKPHINPLTKNNEVKLVFNFKKPSHKIIDTR